MSYPLQLQIEGMQVLVVGGGEIATHKVQELLREGASVRVVGKTISASLQPLAPKLLSLEERAIKADDLDGCRMVIVATDDRTVNREIARIALERGLLVNTVDDPKACNFFAAATVRRGPLTIGIGTDGQAPFLAARVRRLLEALLPPSLATLGKILSEARRRGLRGLVRRDALLRGLSDSKLSRLVEQNRIEEAQARLTEVVAAPEESFEPGTVCIVGAGPGGRSMLTLRALDRIQRADVIVHDALVQPDVLAEALAGTRLVDMGRRAGRGGPEQALTTQLLIKEARSGSRVVRLHAGDPGVFGRAGEESDALLRAAIPFELVPGVSAVLAAPAVAGIPLTMRGEARGFRVRTGHTQDGYVASVDPPLEQDTLVIMMGLGHVRAIMEQLVVEGYAPSTPAAAVYAATRSSERVVAGTIADLSERVAAAAFDGPATLIVGEVAKRAQSKSWSRNEEAAA